MSETRTDVFCIELFQALVPISEKLITLECDGSTRAAGFLLERAGIPYKSYVCEVACKTFNLPIHYFLEIGEGVRLDFGLRHWYGPNHSPAGVYQAGQEEKHGITLKGVKKVTGLYCDTTLFNVLMGQVEVTPIVKQMWQAYIKFSQK